MVRRRTGSKALEQSLYGSGEGDSEGEETTDIGYGDAKAAGRGLGALISSVMEGGGSSGGGGSDTAESRPLLGRAQSSARVRVRETRRQQTMACFGVCLCSPFPLCWKARVNVGDVGAGSARALQALVDSVVCDVALEGSDIDSQASRHAYIGARGPPRCLTWPNAPTEFQTDVRIGYLIKCIRATKALVGEQNKSSSTADARITSPRELPLGRTVLKSPMCTPNLTHGPMA